MYEPYLGLGVRDVEGDMLGGKRLVTGSSEILIMAVFDISDKYPLFMKTF